MDQQDKLLRQQLTELLEGGFAPNIILLREFDHKKAGIILDGLHFSAWILLGHIRARHSTLLEFILNPSENHEVWKDAFWPENFQPEERSQWDSAVDEFEAELKQMKKAIQSSETDLFKVRENGKTISWAAMTALHHTGYHIGQLKTIGRQLGVW